MEEENIVTALKNHFGEEAEIERNESNDANGMLGFDVDGDEYIVGDSDTAYDAAVEEAKECFENCYTDEQKVDWLQKWNWPGVDEEGVCEACSDDPNDYEEDETVYQPSSIEEYLDNMGFSQASDAFSYDFLKSYINMRELGEFVVDTDGIANGLARYDGNEIDLGDYLAYRVN